MIRVLYFSDKDVRRKLFEGVQAAKQLLVVTAVRHARWMRPVAEREPFASLEREHGAVVDQLVLADEGTVEGMWRDPMGDLADALFPEEKAKAYAAASGYVVLEHGAARTVVKKHGSAQDDGWFLREALSKLDAAVPEPDRSQRPGPKRRRTAKPVEEAEREPEAAPPRKAKPSAADPWARLGIPSGASLEEAKKAFRALIAQYHPDKVAHLAPEFRQLADLRTREILEAWERIERTLSDRG